ncbi:MAG TPA: PKD domain-containing protein [Solirubrobacterales bacterium]
MTIALAGLLLVGLVVLGASGSSAHAAGYGQIGEPWGTTGTGVGQLNLATAYGVDPVDGSVYIGDTQPGEPVPGYRLQKFTSGGTFEASAELPAYLKPAEKKERVTFRGVAVDHADGLVYLLEQCGVGAAQPPKCKEVGSGGTLFALALRVYEVAPSGGKLVPAPTPRILLPTSEGDQILKPTSIAVDPVTHGVLVFGSNLTEHKMIERIGPTGTVEARFLDSENKLQPGGPAAAAALVVGPTGTVYTLVGSQLAPGKTRLWELPQNLASLGQVPGFAEAAEAEGWINGAITGASLFVPELMISPDGKSVYWKEGGAEELLVRDFSLESNSTVAFFGGGTGRCKIRSLLAGLGVWGNGAAERLLVFDPGTVEKPRNQVVTFGQGGSGCPTPVAKFKINGSEANGQAVQAEQPVEFSAGSSELLGGEPETVTWNFGDGSVPTVVKCERLEAGGCERPASLKTTHEFENNGEFTVTVEIRLEHAAFGNPAPAEHTVIVEGGAPPPPGEIVVEKKGTGTGTVSSAPAGIECGSECVAPFEAGQDVVLTATPAADSTFVGWGGGCTGGGTCTLTSGGTQSVIADFEAKVAPTEFELSVSASGPGVVTSAPGGISCGSECTHRFGAGATVMLTASPTGTAKFSGWSGVCSGTESICEVAMTETRSVHATFTAAVVGQTLVVSVAGDGAGAVKSARAGINCGVLCEGTYKSGTVVALFPEAMPGSEFISWGGACLGAGVVCELKMSGGGKAVSALFARKPIVVVTPPAAPPAAAVAAAPAPTPTPKPKKKKPSKTSSEAIKKKLAKCRKLKPAAKAKCVRRAHRKPHPKRDS